MYLMPTGAAGLISKIWSRLRPASSSATSSPEGKLS